jgi:tetratricopeptide (TPR) repeat protein/TolB-like protein
MRLTHPLALSVLGTLAFGAFNFSHAQCPDGTPPPCRAATPAPARRAAPPLDERTWIVLPFDNVARASDIDWLRSASVNLLYLDMSRWRDIRVIDDERVADFMREVAAGEGPLGLATAISVARRAGAGKLVMGDLLKVGNRTAVVAKVFDVRTGQRLRSVREETTSPDSLMAIFGRLARGILNAAPPPGAAVGTIGTTSLAAYQEYVAGVQALNAFDLEAAHQRFARALELDSAFALAHYKLSMVYGWERPGAPQRQRHAEAASRFAAGLPQRERTLIAGQLAQTSNRWGEACDAYLSLLRADSTDVEALYNFGECQYHDPVVVAVGGDTANLAFRGSWNTALQAFQRTLELDPTYHLAFAHIPDILHADQRNGCRPAGEQTTCTAFAYTAVIIRRGDSLVTVPVGAGNAGAVGAQQAEAARTMTRRANNRLARDLAAAWVQAGPNEPRAHRALGRALLRTGDFPGAERELWTGDANTPPLERAAIVPDRVELAIKQGRFAEAHAMLDSASRAAEALGTGVRLTVAVLGVSFGKFARADSALRAVAPAPVLPFIAVVIRLQAGVPPPGADSLVRAFASSDIARMQGLRPGDVIGAVSMWDARTVRAWREVAAPDTASRDPRVRLAAFVLRGDTLLIRREAAAFDSALGALPVEAPENGASLAAAEAWLAIGDTAAALARLVEFETRWTYAPLLERVSSGLTLGSFLWPRTFLLLGDLAVARGNNEVAARAYRRVVGMWSGGDADVQPAVQRAREAVARLGGP